MSFAICPVLKENFRTRSKASAAVTLHRPSFPLPDGSVPGKSPRAGASGTPRRGRSAERAHAAPAPRGSRAAAAAAPGLVRSLRAPVLTSGGKRLPEEAGQPEPRAPVAAGRPRGPRSSGGRPSRLPGGTSAPRARRPPQPGSELRRRTRRAPLLLEKRQTRRASPTKVPDTWRPGNFWELKLNCAATASRGGRAPRDARGDGPPRPHLPGGPRAARRPPASPGAAHRCAARRRPAGRAAEPRRSWRPRSHGSARRSAGRDRAGAARAATTSWAVPPPPPRGQERRTAAAAGVPRPAPPTETWRVFLRLRTPAPSPGPRSAALRGAASPSAGSTPHAAPAPQAAAASRPPLAARARAGCRAGGDAGLPSPPTGCAAPRRAGSVTGSPRVLQGRAGGSGPAGGLEPHTLVFFFLTIRARELRDRVRVGRRDRDTMGRTPRREEPPALKPANPWRTAPNLAAPAQEEPITSNKAKANRKAGRPSQ